MDYLIKASAILIIFFVFYKVVLQRETFFQSNRIYLLVGILSALTFPLIVVPIYVEAIVTNIQDFAIASSTNIIEEKGSIDWMQIITYIYLSGVFFPSENSFCHFTH